MKLNKIIIPLLLFQILCFTLSLNLSNFSGKRKPVKEMNIFMKKIQYAVTRYLDFLKAHKEAYKSDLNNRRNIDRTSLKQDYYLIKDAIEKIEKWYKSQWEFYDRLTSTNSRISIFQEDYNNFWANIESAFDYYLEPLDYIDNIKIGTMKIRKCLKYFNGTDCRSYNEIIDILKPNELERYKKKEKGFFASLFGSKK